jgi:hypothetical protein
MPYFIPTHCPVLPSIHCMILVFFSPRHVECGLRPVTSSSLMSSLVSLLIVQTVRDPCLFVVGIWFASSATADRVCRFPASTGIVVAGKQRTARKITRLWLLKSSCWYSCSRYGGGSNIKGST